MAQAHLGSVLFVAMPQRRSVEEIRVLTSGQVPRGGAYRLFLQVFPQQRPGRIAIRLISPPITGLRLCCFSHDTVVSSMEKGEQEAGVSSEGLGGRSTTNETAWEPAESSATMGGD